jgi:hypothetical protein
VADGVVVVERPLAPGSPAVLPADYVLAATGETVVDPDFVTTWDVVADPPP